MNLTEEKKAPIRKQGFEQRKIMLAMHFKSSMQVISPSSININQWLCGVFGSIPFRLPDISLPKYHEFKNINTFYDPMIRNVQCKSGIDEMSKQRNVQRRKSVSRSVSLVSWQCSDYLWVQSTVHSPLHFNNWCSSEIVWKHFYAFLAKPHNLLF